MTAVDPELRQEMLERELHGIEVELESKRVEQKALVRQIARLELDRTEIENLLNPKNTLF